MPSKDLAFLNTALVFGFGNEPDLSVFNEPSRARYLQLARERPIRQDPAMVLNQLRETLEAQKRVDLARVHPTWLARALQDEPLSVRVAVVDRLPASIRSAVAEVLALSPSDLDGEASHIAEIRDVALATATSKLVGDVAALDDDPPVIVALTKLDLPSILRLIRRIGLVKWSITSTPLPAAEQRELDRRRPWIESLGTWNGPFVSRCEADLNRLKTAEARALNGLGLWSLSRLLARVDPHRVRWALQHLPYATAKTVRSRMAENLDEFDSIVGEEARIMKGAWIRLVEEKDLNLAWSWEVES